MLNKTFTPAETEARLYAGWENAGAFAAHPTSAAVPFTIMIPPPNVTGSLHMGHALTFTVQDTLIRWRRMQGRDALWQPGTDHAGIATQMVVERLLGEQGITRQSLGREKFLERVWQWKAESGGAITRQLRRLGASLDWPRERFTMDDGLSEAVRHVFVSLFREGLIYRDKRLVNWDPQFQTAISDLEVENREIRGHIFHLRYPIEGQPGRCIIVATTRPETMLGDMAVAVHPEDARYRDLVGKHAILPLVGRRIPIVADEYSDPEKGTGAVKITPAHDFNDFQVGQRHALEMPSVLDKQARVTVAEIADALVAVDGVADPEFVRGLDGEDRAQARKKIVAELERLELLEKIEPHVNQIPHGDRSGVPIEPLLTTQWFCNAAVLAKPAIEAVETGKTVFVPKQWENTFFSWMRDIQPWCISRQLWWGHRIPAWYGPDGAVFVERDAAAAREAARAHYGRDEPLSQDEDVLDTWFSSALWPFSTLGWPAKLEDVARYYPGDVLVTGFDIIFFWVARMMMMGIHFMGDVPFRTVYIHGLVRDERGQKMSKSKGNAMDPLDLIDSFGADALRFTICALTGPGRDVKLGPSRVESYRSFVTKLWNAARFCEMNDIKADPAFDPASATLPLNRWILDTANSAIVEATTALEAYRFDEYAAACYRFTWNSFCDWFLEFSKPTLAEGDSANAREVRATAAHVLGTILRLLHPAMPFVTEELWAHFGYGAECSLIRASWPEVCAVTDVAAARAEYDRVFPVVSGIRTARSEFNVPPSARANVYIVTSEIQSIPRYQHILTGNTAAIASTARLDPTRAITFCDDSQSIDMRSSIAVSANGVTHYVTFDSSFDLDKERETRATKLKNDLVKVRRDAEQIAQKLANADFVARAPEEVVDENRARLQAAQAEVARLEAALSRIG